MANLGYFPNSDAFYSGVYPYPGDYGSTLEELLGEDVEIWTLDPTEPHDGGADCQLNMTDAYSSADSPSESAAVPEPLPCVALNDEISPALDESSAESSSSQSHTRVTIQQSFLLQARARGLCDDYGHVRIPFAAANDFATGAAGTTQNIAPVARRPVAAAKRGPHSRACTMHCTSAAGVAALTAKSGGIGVTELGQCCCGRNTGVVNSK